MMYPNKQSLKDRILDGWYYLPQGWKVVILLGLLLILGCLIFWGIYAKKSVGVVPIINPSANTTRSPCQSAISEVEVLLFTASGKQQVLILEGGIEILENWIPGFGIAFSVIDELLNVFRDLRTGMEAYTSLEIVAKAIEEFNASPDCSTLINLYVIVHGVVTLPRWAG